MQYEGEVKGLKDFLTGVRGSIAMVTKGDASYSDDSWMKLREVCKHILNCVTIAHAQTGLQKEEKWSGKCLTFSRNFS